MPDEFPNKSKILRAAFAAEADIRAGKLQAGGVLQVWGSREDYDLRRAGEIGEGSKKLRIRNSYSSFYGTSCMFVRYDTKATEMMLFRHQSGVGQTTQGNRQPRVKDLAAQAIGKLNHWKLELAL